MEFPHGTRSRNSVRCFPRGLTVNIGRRRTVIGFDLMTRLGIFLSHQNRGNPSFPAPSRIEILERDARLHGQRRHVGGSQWLLKSRNRQHEVDLIALQDVFRVEARYVIVEVEPVGVAEEDGIRRQRLELKHLRDCNGERIPAQFSGD